MKRNLLVVTASIFMVAFMLSRSAVLTVHAGCGETGVSVGGADCGLDGSTPSTSGGDEGSDDNGSPGSSSNSNNNENKTNNGNAGVSCTPGTAVDWDFALPV